MGMKDTGTGKTVQLVFILSFRTFWFKSILWL